MTVLCYLPHLPHVLPGSMPDKAGPIDPTWAANLEATIQAFAEQGVYVFLEANAYHIYKTYILFSIMLLYY